MAALLSASSAAAGLLSLGTLLGALPLSTTSALAQPSPDAAASGGAGASAAGKRLERLRREIAHLAEERERLVRNERGVLGRLERLEADARLLDAQAEELRLELGELAEEFEKIREREEAAKARLEEARERLAKMLRLLWHAGPFGRVRPLVEAASAERLAAGLRLTHELSARQREQVRQIRQALGAVADLRREREAKEAALAARREEALAARAALRASIAQRRELLARLRSEEDLRERAIDELERARDELEDVVAGLAAPREVPLDVEAFAGLLPMPVEEGRVRRPFGDRRDPRLGTRLPHAGWDIDVDFGERVRPIFEGEVVFADWFRGYGLMVVVDHGSGVHSVYAHLSAILAPVGTPVTRETVIGRVGDTGSLRGAYLYFEIRQGGRAADPADWIRRDGLP